MQTFKYLIFVIVYFAIIIITRQVEDWRYIYRLFACWAIFMNFDLILNHEQVIIKRQDYYSSLTYLKRVIRRPCNLVADQLMRFQVIIMAQLIVFSSVVRVKCSMGKKAFHLKVFLFWWHKYNYELNLFVFVVYVKQIKDICQKLSYVRKYK